MLLRLSVKTRGQTNSRKMPISKNNTPQNLNLFSHHITFFSQGLQSFMYPHEHHQKKERWLEDRNLSFFHWSNYSCIKLLNQPSKPTKLKLEKKVLLRVFFNPTGKTRGIGPTDPVIAANLHHPVITIRDVDVHHGGIHVRLCFGAPPSVEKKGKWISGESPKKRCLHGINNPWLIEKGKNTQNQKSCANEWIPSQNSLFPLPINVVGSY